MGDVIARVVWEIVTHPATATAAVALIVAGVFGGWAYTAWVLHHATSGDQ